MNVCSRSLAPSVYFSAFQKGRVVTQMCCMPFQQVFTYLQLIWDDMVCFLTSLGISISVGVGSSLDGREVYIIFFLESLLLTGSISFLTFNIYSYSQNRTAGSSKCYGLIFTSSFSCFFKSRFLLPESKSSEDSGSVSQGIFSTEL